MLPVQKKARQYQCVLEVSSVQSDRMIHTPSPKLVFARITRTIVSRRGGESPGKRTGREGRKYRDQEGKRRRKRRRQGISTTRRLDGIVNCDEELLNFSKSRSLSPRGDPPFPPCTLYRVPVVPLPPSLVPSLSLFLVVLAL